MIGLDAAFSGNNTFKVKCNVAPTHRCQNSKQISYRASATNPTMLCRYFGSAVRSRTFFFNFFYFSHFI